MKSLLVFTLAFALIGCGKKSTKPQNGSIVTELQLTNSIGIPTTAFRVGEDQRFSFIVTNRTGKPQPFGAAQFTIAIFYVFKEDSLVGTSMDLADPNVLFPAFIKGQLLDGESLLRQDSWSANSEHQALPVGIYILMAAPWIQFSNFAVFPNKTIDFEVVP